MQLLRIFFVILNIGGLFLMAYDKYRAKRGQWRVQEKTLFGVAACGGALGIWAGMAIFRHKTRHISFLVGIPLIIAFQVMFWLYVTNHGFVLK
ncbi:MAG TPA: DUF1294 domain-containing protein [Bacillota bacterium]|nr:DUF1294 domain-containing protein [Bacillota bacterium]